MKKTFTLLLITGFFFIGAHAAVAQTASPSTPGTATAPATSGTAANTSNFVPLTALPGLSSITQSNQNFITFFNSLYKVCVGAAAALALLQIMRAGFMWMSAGDSVEQVGRARSLITSSIFGLVLVLSPVIVFSFISPRVLTLQLDTSQLGTGSPAAPTPSNPGPSLIPSTGQANPACRPMPDGTVLTANDSEQCCSNQTKPGVTCFVNQVGDINNPQRICQCNST